MRSPNAPIAVAAALLLAATTLAACSSSGSGSESSSPPPGGPTASTALRTAQAAYAKYTQTQPAAVIAPLTSKPPTGLTITVTSCPLPVCKTETDPAVEAAKKFGWKVKVLQSDTTPQAYQSVINQIVQDPPKLAAISPIVPNSFVSGQLAALQKAGTKIAEVAPAGDEPSANGPVLAAVNGAPQLSQSGRLMGDAVEENSGGKAKSVFVWDPSVVIWKPLKAAFSNVVEGAGGSAASLQVSVANIGKSIPTQVVSYVQSHPDVKYVALAVADLAAGVPQALQAAGLSDQVKIISRAPQAANLADIADGSEWASVGEENSSNGYRVIDQLARLSIGQSLGALRNPAGWAQIFVKSNVTQTKTAPATPGYPQAYLKAWNLP